MAPADIALITERRFENPARVTPYVANILEEDRLLAAALSRRGLTTVRVDWSRPEVDWSAFRLAVFRTTWDYFDRFAAFRAWLSRIERENVRVLNALSTVRWNMDKHYLGDLEGRGLPVVPTAFVPQGQPVSLAQLLQARGWSEAVIKPAVSGAARETHRVHAANLQQHEVTFARLVNEEAMLVQPFLPEIMTQGEVTVVLMGGQPTHAIRKQAKPGDFRVQDDHGGTVHPHDATSDELDLAVAAMTSVKPLPAYGRVDIVRGSSGELQIMEMELIEPELWMRFHPPAAGAFAAALADSLA